jgi:hypothetical protein
MMAAGFKRHVNRGTHGRLSTVFDRRHFSVIFSINCVVTDTDGLIVAHNNSADHRVGLD